MDIGRIGKTITGSDSCGACRKGQFFAYDAIVAGALLSVMIALLFIYWSSVHSMIFNQVDDMYRTGMSITDTLLTPGSPSNWNATNVHQVGLTDEFDTLKLNSTKVDNLKAYADSNYDALKESFGSGQYDFLISIKGYSSPIGIEPSNPTAKITMSRPVIYNGAPSLLSVIIWMNYSI